MAISKLEHIRGEMIFDFVSKMQITERVDAEYFKALAKSHVAKNKYNEAAMIIYKFKFHAEFDIFGIMNKLVDANKIASAKALCELDMQYTLHLIKVLSTNDNAKVAAGIIQEFKLDINDFP